MDQLEGSPELSRLVDATAVAVPEPLVFVPLSLLLPGRELESTPAPAAPLPPPPSSDELCRDCDWASDEADEEADKAVADLAWMGVWKPPFSC